MAQVVSVQLIDDLGGSEIPDGKGRTIPFALDGTSYEIDLSETNEQALVDALARYVGNARKGQPAGPGKRRSRTVAGRDYNGRVRAWAKDEGYAIGDKGRIPAQIMAKYAAAHP